MLRICLLVLACLLACVSAQNYYYYHRPATSGYRTVANAYAFRNPYGNYNPYGARTGYNVGRPVHYRWDDDSVEDVSLEDVYRYQPNVYRRY